MRALIQRVTHATVRVDGDVVGAIGPGLVVFVGVTHGDDSGIARKLADKIGNLRVFPGVRGDDGAPTDGASSRTPEAGRMDRSLLETGREALVVSQFTLYGDARKGRRPSWQAAAPPEMAEPLVEEFVGSMRALGVDVQTGRFRAEMQVELVNDGPVTLMLEVEAVRV